MLRPTAPGRGRFRPPLPQRCRRPRAPAAQLAFDRAELLVERDTLVEHARGGVTAAGQVPAVVVAADLVPQVVEPVEQLDHGARPQLRGALALVTGRERRVVRRRPGAGTVCRLGPHGSDVFPQRSAFLLVPDARVLIMESATVAMSNT